MIITAFVFSSVSVIATSTYYANQIVYGNTTLGSALDELYSDVNEINGEKNQMISNLQNQLNDYKSLTLTIYGSSASTTKLGIGQLLFSNLSGKYTHFKVTSISGTSAYNKQCDVALILQSSTYTEEIVNVNQEYLVSNYHRLNVRSLSLDNNNWNNCVATVNFYSK